MLCVRRMVVFVGSRNFGVMVFSGVIMNMLQAEVFMLNKFVGERIGTTVRNC